MQATFAAMAEFADLGWFDRVLRPSASGARSEVDPTVFERRSVAAGYEETFPRVQSDFSAVHGLLSSVR